MCFRAFHLENKANIMIHHGKKTYLGFGKNRIRRPYNEKCTVGKNRIRYHFHLVYFAPFSLFICIVLHLGYQILIHASLVNIYIPRNHVSIKIWIKLGRISTGKIMSTSINSKYQVIRSFKITENMHVNANEHRLLIGGQIITSPSFLRG